MAKAAPRHRDRQHRTGLRDDARSDRAGERLSGGGAANRRLHGRRRIRGQGRRGRTVPGSTPFAAKSTWPGWPLSPASWLRPHWPPRRSTVKEGTSTRNATAFGAPEHGPGMPRVSQGRAPSTPGRGRGVEHAGPARRRRDRRSVRAHCGSSASCPIPPHWRSCPTSS